MDNLKNKEFDKVKQGGKRTIKSELLQMGLPNILIQRKLLSKLVFSNLDCNDEQVFI